MEAFFDKKYKLDSSENFDDFMKALGVGLITRKMGNAASPVVELKKDGDEYIFNSTSTFKNMTKRFKPGVEMDEETPDGRKVKSTMTLDGAILREKQVNADGSVTTLDRTFTADEMILECKFNDITCKRIYKAQA